ncbi:MULTISPECIES: family 14 glycosylhydrolase [unclassified Clostridium]|uniref:Beta-amylase n=1 Tax=Clostridium botulinum (strain Eklund 17B / Type B) TaxID=935198 RepID=B2TI88_CLOBB|nr:MULTISPECIES: family 14 glycosylhydrolase [unclassified Clostridium]ACD23373.1 beta-amylase [Clostridium botulinum B str. Eklund 17B (NRP)]MBN1038616.1 beta-amylase [Clostridium botulinum]MBN1055331.1 beta-amylase [Clostridium botulinum]MBY6977251.1 family 14 glycosylhydrolase [Clostridium botulinum]MBY6999408.1 family 14 glycosylhydrolase [Clostridium botulinum]
MKCINKNFKKYLGFMLAVMIAFTLFLSSNTCAYASSINKNYKAYVMAPLEKIEDWNKFKNQLITLKNKGVYALTTDIWWGEVESKGDNQFDWNYYKTYANIVRESGLKWVPILSTHQCGGSVNNTDSKKKEIKIPLPSWLWSQDTADNMQIKDEIGQWDKETLSPWWSGTENQYAELYSSFASNFSDYKDIIAKIYLSGGASGELRFPSYSFKGYPTRGYLQCYSGAAIADFQNSIKNKYTTISSVNDAWNTNLTSFEEITPPTDGDNFFENGYKTTYGKDFFKWYQGVLEKHLNKIASIAHENFDPVFDVRIGAKVAGIHWLMNSPNMPHSAEYCAGYCNYNSLLDEFKESNLDLTFTCLEMNDSKAYDPECYSTPKSLVINIANLAKEKGLRMFGENGLVIENNNQSYENCAEMLYNYDFSGFTILRLANLFNDDGTAKAELDSFANIVVNKPVPVTFTIDNVNLNNGENLYLTGDGWEMSNWTTGLYPSQFNYKDGKATVTVNLAEGNNYEFKAIKKDSNGKVIWENGGNHSYTVPTNGGECNFSWNN